MSPHTTFKCLLAGAALLLPLGCVSTLATANGQTFCQLDAGPSGRIVVGLVELAEGLAPGVGSLLVEATDAAANVVASNCALAAAKIGPAVTAVPVPPPATPTGVLAIVPVPGTPVLVSKASP